VFVLVVMPLALAGLAGVYVLMLSGMTPSEYRERLLLAVINRRFEMGEPLAGMRPRLWELVARKMLRGHVYADEWREVREGRGVRLIPLVRDPLKQRQWSLFTGPAVWRTAETADGRLRATDSVARGR
jgi:hypothetical protein